MDKPLPSELARRISFRQLQVFETIARVENFTRAAEELFLTQPTVSTQIKKLEESVGSALFEQIGKKVYLTSVGQELFHYSREILDSVAHFEMQAANLRGLKKGHLRLAVVTTAKYYAPMILGRFCQQYPGIDISLKVTNRENLLDRLGKFLDDLYIIGEPPENSETHFIPLIENQLVVIAPRNHEISRQKAPVKLSEIVKHEFIMREKGSGTRQAIEKHMATHKLEMKIRMEIGSNEAIKHAVASGLGIAILSDHTMALTSDGGPLVKIDVEGFPISWPWYIGHTNKKRLSVVAKAFLDFIYADKKEHSPSIYPFEMY